MARKSSLAALVAFGATLAACSPTLQNAAAMPNRSLDSVNQPVVQRTDYVIDLTTDGDGLSPSERGRLKGWFESLGLGYGDRVSVDEAYGPSRSRNDVAKVAAEYGLLLSEGAPVTAGVQPGGLRVIVSRSTASVPGCPIWQGPGGPSSTSPNYGCGVNSNLDAMVADPSDLVLGQAGSGTGDSTTASKAIKVYREAKPTGTKGLIINSTHRGN